MERINDVPASVIDAFQLMWGNFPEPVSLVHKSRNVVAVNKWHQKAGYLTPGMNCAKLGAPGSHKGCLGNKALASGEATYSYNEKPDGTGVTAFWIPLDGYPELFVHFGVGISLNYKTGEPTDFLKNKMQDAAQAKDPNNA